MRLLIAVALILGCIAFSFYLASDLSPWLTGWSKGFSDGVILCLLVIALTSWIEEWEEKDGGGE